MCRPRSFFNRMCRQGSFFNKMCRQGGCFARTWDAIAAAPGKWCRPLRQQYSSVTVDVGVICRIPIWKSNFVQGHDFCGRGSMLRLCVHSDFRRSNSWSTNCDSDEIWECSSGQNCVHKGKYQQNCVEQKLVNRGRTLISCKCPNGKCCRRLGACTAWQTTRHI